jgi:hypothetical protein
MMTASIAGIRFVATALAVGALSLAPAGVALGQRHHHHHYYYYYCDNGDMSSGKCAPSGTRGGPGGLGKVHGPGSSHNPIIVPSQPTVTVRDHRGQPPDRSSVGPQRTSQTCTKTNQRGCIVDHRTPSGSRIRWQPPGTHPPHPGHPTPQELSCLAGHWSDCAPAQIRNHKPVPCLGNLC